MVQDGIPTTGKNNESRWPPRAKICINLSGWIYFRNLLDRFVTDPICQNRMKKSDQFILFLYRCCFDFMWITLIYETICFFQFSKCRIQTILEK